MFDDIGGKIKNLATVICVVGIIASVILAIALWSQNDKYNPTVALGFGVLIGGCVGSWVGSFFMYGFGELIDETTRNREISQQILLKLSASNDEKPTVSNVRDVPVAFSGDRVSSGALRAHAVATSSSSTSGWVCKNCGTRNVTGDMLCKGCGNYK